MRLKWYRGKWYAVWIEGGRTRRLSLRTADRGAAEQALADLTRAPAGDAIADIYSAYLEDLEARGRSAERPVYAWRHLEPVFGGLRPDQVTPERCRAYAARRTRAGARAGTIGKELGSLRTALRWRDRNTPARFDMPAAAPPRERHLTRAEYRRLRVGAKPDFHVYVFVVLALATAARRSALLELTWDRVDFARGRIRLGSGDPGAPRKGRATVPMTRHARRVLRLAHKVGVSDHVIEYGGRPIASVRHGFAAACRRAGLEGVTPHTLRHTAAVWMAEAGVPMSEIAQYLGHADDRITQRVYARYSPDYLADAARALG